MAKNTTPIPPYTYAGTKITFGNGVDTYDFTLNPGPINGSGWSMTGGNGSDIITGSVYADFLWGDSLGNSGTNSDNGADTLRGGAGNDEIHGGNGADVLSGDAGADTLYGDKGGDTFKYWLTGDSAAAAGGIWSDLTGDWIKDFTASQGDKLDLSAVPVTGPFNALTWGSGADVNGAWSDGNFVYADTSGDGIADLVIKVAGVGVDNVLGINHDPTAPATKSVTTIEDSATGAIAIGASDSDPGDTLNYALKSGAGPTKGQVTFDQAAGTFIYSPSANLNGSDSFTVVISDGHGGSTEQIVSVTIDAVNDAPEADPTNSAITDEDTASGAVAIGATDVDGDTLTYAVKTGAEPAKGEVAFDQAAGTFTYTPDANANGSDSFTILISDGNGGTAEQVVTVTINAVDDLSVDDSSTAGDEDTEITGSLGATTTSGGDLVYTLMADVDNGTLTLNPDGSYSYQGGSNYNGSDSFTVKVVDADAGEEKTVTVSLTIDPVDDLSVSHSSSTGEEDAEITGSIGASTTSGGLLSYTLVDDVDDGTLTLNLDGTYSYKGDLNYNGSDSFKVKVTDADAGEEKTVTVSLTIDPVNDAPEAVLTNSAITDEDTASGAVAIGATDVDGDTLTYAVKAGAEPAKGEVAFNQAAGTFIYTPDANANGSDGFTILVSDGNGGTVEQVVTVTINPVDDLAVILVGGATGSVTEDAVPNTTSGNLNSTDIDSPADSWTAVVSAQATTYGSFMMTAAGVWTYSLNNANPTVNALNTGSPPLSDSFTVYTSDGQSKLVSISIAGHTDVSGLPAPVPAGTTGDPNDFDGLGNSAGETDAGGSVANTIYGGAGNDTINGNNGNDTIYGGSGSDGLNGNNDLDTLYGGSGEDVLLGSNQDDILIGGWSADRLVGGNGIDTFKFLSANDRGDYIEDFAAGEKINLHDLGVTHLSSGADAHGVWDYGAGSTTVQGVTYSGDVYAADIDGDASTIEFWFVVAAATPSLTAGDFTF